MIRPININLNAAHPELPLVEATTFTGAPSSVFIRGVPKSVGNWSITAVNVAVTYPDNTTTARAAVESAEGVWVATIPGTATSGRTTAGFRVMADGIDENGDAVTGYVLGFADFSVLSFMPVPAPGDTFYLLRYFDQAPATPKEGDAAKIDGVLKFYNGSAWEPFAAPVTLDDTVTPASANGVKSSGIWSALWGALSALPTGVSSLYDWCVAQLAGKVPTSRKVNGKALSSNVTLTGADIAVSGSDPTKIDAALAGKASTADATLAERGLSDWVCVPSTYDGHDITIVASPHPDAGMMDYTPYANGEQIGVSYTATEDADYIHWESPNSAVVDIVATRTVLQGYRLGPDEQTNPNRDKPLASEAEAEALRTGKQNALSAQQLANIAAVPSKADSDGPTITSGMTVQGSIYAERIYTQYNQTQACYGPEAIEVPSGGVAILPTLAQGDSGILALTAGTGHAGNLAALDADGNPTDSTIPAASVAVKGNIRYAISESIPLTVTSGAADTTLDDRTHNVRTVAAPRSGNTTTITATLPPIVQGKSRDMFLNLTVGSAASDAGDISLSIVEPSGATVQIDIGSVEDIGVGRNEILISENALPTTSGNVTTTHWLVTVRHEDFAA